MNIDHRAQSPPLHPFTLAMHRAARSSIEARAAIAAARHSPDKIGAEEGWIDRAQKWVDLASDTLFRTANAPAEFFRHQINQSLRDAGNLLRDATDETNKTVVQAVRRTASGLEDALRSIGTGAGDGFAGFLGVPPWVLLAGGVLVLGSIATGSGLLFLSPAGQALGTGAAAGLGSAGAGLGSAAGGLGAAALKMAL